MLNEKIAKLLNTQINKEFYSALPVSPFCKLLCGAGPQWICQLVSDPSAGRARSRAVDAPVPTK